jgi:hypothetical protein
MGIRVDEALYRYRAPSGDRQADTEKQKRIPEVGKTDSRISNAIRGALPK